jgi:hypothetical protein
MPEDLPIYSDTPLRTGLQFAELERLKGADVSLAFPQTDAWISALEGATGVTAARESLTTFSRDGLLRIHALLFPDRAGAGPVETSLPSTSVSRPGLCTTRIH